MATTLAPPIDLEPKTGSPGAEAHAPSYPRMEVGRERRPILRKIFSEGFAVFVVSCVLYITVGALLDFHYHTFNGDAVARMANAFYVLYSRDPHLAAVGFVWNPGTSIADFFPLLFYHFWTPLASQMFSASLVSAACMAGGVYQVRCTLLEWGVSRGIRLILVAILALNGMILYYGGNGMSEGLYLFTLLATCRYLLRWMRSNDLRSLVYSAIALGLCYLTRNEAVGPAVLAGILVFIVAGSRNSKSRTNRFRAGFDDLIIFEIPFVFSFVGWAFASLVITGSPFQQFTSVYGTTSQIKVAGTVSIQDRVMQDIHDVFYLAPAIPVIAVVALLVAARRRDVGVFAPIAVVGGGLAFDLMAYINNSIQPWFRYFITAVPLEVLLVGSFFATVPALMAVGPHIVNNQHWFRRRPGAVLASVILLILLVPGFITTVMGMANPTVGYEETQNLGFIFSKHPSAREEEGKTTWPTVMTMVKYFDQRHLADGQVLVDNFSVCIPNVIVASQNPDIFVIPNDRDFQRTLADPLTFHAHYILEADPKKFGALTAPNIAYPTLWSTGDHFARVVHTFKPGGICPDFRLFQVYGHPGLAG